MTYKGNWSTTSYSRNAEYWLQQPDGTYQVEDAYTQIGLNTNNLGAKDIDGYSKHSGTPYGYYGSGYVGSTYVYRFYYDRNSYRIDYYYGGQKLSTASNIFFDADITGDTYNYEPPMPAGLQDATWGGWYADANLETPYTFNKMPGNNLALYAKWALPDRTITFVDESSGAEPQSETYPYGAQAESIAPEKRVGYTFQGWYADAACTRIYDFEKPLTEDTTVYAKWAADILSYTVRYVDASDESVEVLPAKTVSSPALALGSSITEKAAVVAGMLPDVSLQTINLALTGNEIVFRYTHKRNVITYDVRYVLANDESIEVAPAKTGIQVSGDIVSVKESAATVDYALLQSQGVTGQVLHPESEVIDYTFSMGDNTIVFKYVPYQSSTFTVNYRDMDGNLIEGVQSQQESVKVGGGFAVPTGLAGYTLDHVEKNGADQGKRVYYVATDGHAVTIDVYYRTKLTVTAQNKSKVYDGTALKSSGVGDVTVSGLQPGHELAGIEFTGEQTAVGSSATTPKNARIAGPANANYYDIEYISGNLTVTAPAVVVTIAGDVVEATYDGLPHTAGYTVESISNPDFDASFIVFNGAAAEVERTHAGTTTLPLQGQFGVVDEQAGNFDVTFVVSDGSVAINPAPLTIASGSAKRAYDGTPLTNADVTVEGLVNGETLPVKATGARTDAGTAENTVEPDWAAASAQQGDYEITVEAGTLEVTPAKLTITALDQTYIYNGNAQGEAAATYTDATQIGGKVAVSGLAAGDTLASIALDGQQTKVGVYEEAIVPSAAQVASGHAPDADDEGNLVDPRANYTVDYVAGTLTISENADDLTLTAESGGGVYNGNAYGLNNVSASLANAAIEYKVGDGEWTSTAPTATDVAQSIEGISVRAVLEGYTTAQVDGLSIVVTPKPVTVTAANDGKTYGAADPEEFHATAEGLLGDDTVAFTVTRDEGEDVGGYAIVPAGDELQGNYAVSYVPALFTISPAAITVRAQDAGKVYGEADPTLSAEVEGVVDGFKPAYTLERVAGEDAGTYVITASGATVQGNYTVSFVPATFEISRAAVTVTALDATKVYGQADPVFQAEVEGVLPGDEGVIRYDFDRAAGRDVGEYAITPVGAAVQGNYTVTYAPALLSITPAAVTVVADDATKVYGQADPDAFGARVTGLQYDDADDVIVWTATREAGENVGEYAITPAGDESQGNYTVTYLPGTFEITPASVVVRAQDAGKVYGQADPVLSAQVEGLIGDDTVEYAVTRVEGEHAGVYAITATGSTAQGNYTVSYEDATFTISKAKLSVAVADATKVYGDPDPAFTVEVSGLQFEDTAGLISYTLTREPGKDVGEYTLALAGADVQGDYEVSYVPAKLTITPAPVTVRVDDAQKTYGDVDPAFSAQVEGLKLGDPASSIAYTLSRSAGEDVGTYPITATGRADQGNYTVAFEAGTLAIGQAEVVVTPVNAVKTYGEADPALTATVSGLRNGDTAAVLAYELSRAAGEDVGTYAITANGEPEQGNYRVAYGEGTFEIVAAGTLTVAGQDIQAVYSGMAIGVAATPSVESGTTVEYSVDDGKTWSADVPTRIDVGTTTVQVRATNPNYTAATATYTLEVQPKDVTVTAVNAGKVYGEDDPEAFEYSVSGLVNGEDETLITVTGVTRASGEDVGEYAITPAGEATQGNYRVTFEPGAFTISAKGVTVTGNDASKVYGTADPELSATAEGLVGDDTIEYTVSRSEGENVGTYAVIPKGAEVQGNYLVSYVTGHFNITKAQATVTAQPASKTYGDADPTWHATVDGLVGLDTLAYTLSRTPGEDAGSYEIMPAGDATQDNYEVTFVPAEFTIEPALAVVTADDKVQTYGGTPKALTATVTGLKRGDDASVIAYELSRVAGTDAGDYEITPAGEAAQGNYRVAFERGTYTIVPATATVAARDASKVYGQDDPALSAAVSGVLFDDEISYELVRTPGEDAGSYAISAMGDARQGNYRVVFAPATFTIEKAHLVVAADAKTQVYGDAELPLTATVTGLANGDAATVVSYTLARAAGTDVGSYAITPTLSADPANYTVSLEPATYAITPATATVVALDSGKTYGDADPALSAVVRGLKNGDGASTVAYTVDRAAGENAGTYAIVPSGAVEQGNYLVEYQPATFTIDRAAVTVAADAAVKEYGAPDPAFTATVSGLVAGDTASVLDYELSREEGEDAGTYAIAVSGEVVQGNYTVSYAPSTLTIARSGALAVAGSDVNVVYDGMAHGGPAVASVTGGTTVEYSVDGGATWQDEVPTRTDAGETAVQVRATNPNYEDATASYTITVTPRPVTVAAQAASKTYGEDDPEFAATVTGVVGDDALAYTLSREEGEDVGTYAITAAGEEAQGNYLVTYLPAAFTIERSGALAVFALGTQAVYDGESHAISAAIPTVTEGTTLLYRVGDAGEWSEDLPSAIDAGVYDIRVRATNPNYHDAATTCQLVIERAPITVSAVASSKVYGDADPALSATIEGLVDGDDPAGITYTLARDAGENAGAYAITPAGAAEQGNYRVSFAPAVFTINQAPATVVVQPANKVYGDADPAFTATVSGLKADDDASAIRYSISREAGEDVGTYVLAAVGGASQGNYAVTYQASDLTIKRAAAMVTPVSVSKIYGDADPVYTAAVTGLKNGDDASVLSYQFTRESGEDVGEYAIEAAGPQVQGNYEVSYATGTLTIVRAGTLAVSGTSLEGVYTGEAYGVPAVPSVSAGTTVEYRVNGQAWTKIVPTRTDVGEDRITVRAVNPNYETATAAYTLSVSPAEAVVSATDASKIYGEADPVSLGYTVSGLVAGEPESLISVDGVTRAAGEDAGDYRITPEGSASQGNYRVTYQPGTFTIAPKAVTVAAQPAEKVYGESDPAFTARVTGLVAGDDADVLQYTISRTPGEDVGAYAIVPSGTAAQGNYSVTYTAADLTITRAPLTVAAQDATQVYGAAEMPLAAQVTGLVAGDTADVVSYTLGREPGTAVGTYAIAPSGAAVQGNYTVSYESASYTITPAEATVFIQNAAKAYATPDPAFTARVTGLVAGDDESVVNYTLSREPGEDVGTYALTATGAQSQGNYTVSFVPATFEIVNSGELAVVGTDTRATYRGEPISAAEAMANVAGAVVEYRLDDAAQWSTEVPAATDAGTYMVHARATAPGYDPAETSYALVIDRAEVTVAADGAQKTYGEADPAFTAQVLGLQGDDAEDVIVFTVTRSDADDQSAGDHATVVPAGEATQGNYTVSYRNGTLHIAPAQATVTAADASKVYGEPDPEFTATVDGLVAGVSADAIAFTVGRSAGEDASASDAGYAITPAGETIQGNYRITYVLGTLGIEPRPVEVTSGSAEKAYDGLPLYARTAEVTGGEGFLDGEEPAYLFTGVQTYVGSSENTFAVDPASSTRLGNYRITLVPGTLTVTDEDVSQGQVVTKSHGDATVALGQRATFDIEATNIYAEPKTITLEEQPGVELAQSVFPDVAPGATVRTTATYEVTDADVAAGSFQNKVQVRFDGVDDTYEGEDTVHVVEGRVDVSKVILNPQERYFVGDQILYLVTITNATGKTLRDVTVEDVLGNGASVEVTSSGDGVVNGSNVTFAELEPEATRTITLAYTVQDSDVGTRIANTAVVELDDDPGAGDSDTAESNPVTGLYRLLIHYVYENGAEAAPDYDVQLEAGTAFDVATPDVAGYTPDYSRIASGDAGMPARDIELYVTYRANEVPIPAEPEPGDTPGPAEPEPGVSTEEEPSAPEPGSSSSSSEPEQPTPGTPSESTPEPPEQPASSSASAPRAYTETTPAPATPSTPAAAPRPSSTPGASVITNRTPVPPAGIVTIADDGTPQVEALYDDTTPLASVEGSWSLFDLLATLLMLIVAIVLAIGAIGRKRKGDEEEDEEENAAAESEAAAASDVSQDQAPATEPASVTAYAATEEQAEADEEEDEDPQVVKRHRVKRLVAIILAILAVVLLLLTQDFTQPMTWFDQWTIVFAIMLLVQLVVALLARKKKRDDEQEDEQEEEPQPATDAAAAPTPA
ncbi:MAG: MBG domain-containing protein [Coriobacteriaceae bacterium]|nr:MBG domain-containing protein [Coriobacteriaceae bacterium]